MPPLFLLAMAALAPLKVTAEALDRDDFSALWPSQDATGCRHIPAADMTRVLAGV